MSNVARHDWWRASERAHLERPSLGVSTVASKKICENNIIVFSNRQIQHLHICSVLFILAIQARRKCLFSRDFDSAAGAECVADGTVDDARPAHVHSFHFGAARDCRRLPPPARRRPDEQQAHQSGQRRAASDWGRQPVCKETG